MTCIHELGLSAQAIAGHGGHHPHDPSDLLRCMRYCEGRYSTEQLQERMAGRSIYWDRLLPHWAYLVDLLTREMASATDGMAPLTYRAMRRILEDGNACTDCRETGRGAPCGKCKGTGRRGGGTCRADRCYRGAALCPTCRGNGYTPKETP